MSNWSDEIVPKRNLFHVNLYEITQYKDLLFLFVKRDFISLYKQTILGPLWFFIQPILTTLIFTVVFGKNCWNFNRWFTSNSILSSWHYLLELFFGVFNQNIQYFY